MAAPFKVLITICKGEGASEEILDQMDLEFDDQADAQQAFEALCAYTEEEDDDDPEGDADALAS